MNRKRKKSVLVLPRRKWARRGRATADFTASAFFTVVEHTVNFGIWISRKIWLGVSSSRRKPKAFAKKVDIKVVEPMFRPFSKAKLKDITFDSVIGLEDVKEQIKQRLLLPFEHRKKAKILKIAKGGGILLYGPPGNGKTLLAMAVASLLNIPFFYVTPADIIRNGMGISAQRVSELFRLVRSYPLAILFIDEVDGLISSRSVKSVIMKSIIHQFLVETDGLESKSSDNTLLMMSATNRIWVIDKAMKRRGRFGNRIYVGLPDLTARELILRKNMEETPGLENIDFGQLAQMTEMFSGTDLVDLVERARQPAFNRSILLEGKKTVSAVTMDDFLTVLETFEPSVSKEDLPKYGGKEMIK